MGEAGFVRFGATALSNVYRLKQRPPSRPPYRFLSSILLLTELGRGYDVPHLQNLDPGRTVSVSDPTPARPMNYDLLYGPLPSIILGGIVNEQQVRKCVC